MKVRLFALQLDGHVVWLHLRPACIGDRWVHIPLQLQPWSLHRPPP